jgi:hypothetical protein
MSEFKAQLLGMLLVILVFVGISAAVTTMFQNETESISNAFRSVTESSESSESSSSM